MRGDGAAAAADARRGCPGARRCSSGSASRRALPEDEARTLLAHYRLGAEAIDRPLGRLSPGERARVHVAAIVGAGADLILLDEPTNHLDFDTLEVIEAALRAYRGTLVVATHDRALLEAVGCDRVLEVRGGESRRWVSRRANDRFQVCRRRRAAARSLRRARRTARAQASPCGATITSDVRAPRRPRPTARATGSSIGADGITLDLGRAHASTAPAPGAGHPARRATAA